MSRYTDMMTRIAAGECILIDGATGTEAERRGVPQLDNAWNGGGALSHPDIVRQVHLDYLEAGAEVIISNSFATHLHALEAAGEGARFEDYNRRAVELAVEARAAGGHDKALVAGGISYWSWRGDMPSAREMQAATSRQAGIMKAAGADLIMLEMMIDQSNLETTLDAVRDIGLPVWAGITTSRAPEGHIRLRKGDPLAPAVRALAAGGVELINIMHTEVEFVAESIDAVRDDWSGPIGVYAHSSNEVDKRWVFDDVISPHDYGELADGWRAQGLSLIGGCCGIGEAHIHELCRRMQHG